MTEVAAIEYTTQTDIAPIPAGTHLLALNLRVFLGADAPPLAPLPSEQIFNESPWPAVRIMLQPAWNSEEGRFVIAYTRFHTLRLARVHLQSAVGSFVQSPRNQTVPLSPLVLENDDGPLDGKRPFEPFGPAPAVGAVMAFTHPDLLWKPLRGLRLHLTWMGGPEDLRRPVRRLRTEAAVFGDDQPGRLPGFCHSSCQRGAAVLDQSQHA